MGYWVYELLDLWDHELIGSLIWFVGFINFVGYMFLMDTSLITIMSSSNMI